MLRRVAGLFGAMTTTIIMKEASNGHDREQRANRARHGSSILSVILAFIPFMGMPFMRWCTVAWIMGLGVSGCHGPL